MSLFKSFKFRRIVIQAAIFLCATASARAEDIPGRVGYDKGFYIRTEDDKFLLKINTQIQPQYQFLSMEGQENVNTFQIRRGRLNFSGNVFNPDLTYKIEFEVIGGRSNTTRQGERRATSLRDAYVAYDFRDTLAVQVGQFKPPFNREELTSSTKLQLVDQSIVNDVFTYGYDLGLALKGKWLDKKLEYTAFVTNEGNSNDTTNFNNEMLLGAFVTYNILGQHGATMGDVEHSEKPQLAASTGLTVSQPAAANDATIVAGTANSVYRYRGFSALAEFDAAHDYTSTRNVFGFLGQTGYFLVPKRFEIAGRFAGVIATQNGAPNGYEAGGGLNYYFKGHNVKLQTDYAALINSPLVFGGAATAANFVTTGNNPGFTQDQVDHRIRTQLQLYF